MILCINYFLKFINFHRLYISEGHLTKDKVVKTSSIGSPSLEGLWSFIGNGCLP